MERLLRKAVRNKLIITFTIALIGGALIGLSPRLGRVLLWVGSAVMLASPWISYVIVLKLYREKVLTYDEEDEDKKA
ncbi:hypothetical protein DDW02_01255 [Acidilobus sp. SCGC AC-742_M05]|nr:hypothetical protein DDW02_01280 [Acidilobus sp. SCGC AC-742_M05]PVU68385.1 hypothetical protein DDW02_01255 [Acidilobus sp. SCGC AC-742_M05]PVU73149.1 hypothetical protein DDW07_01890 [Acidilobus sp. SCGC AC-742_E15]